MTILLAALPLFVQAEDITFDNEPSKLKPDSGKGLSLFPSNSLQGNTVKVISGTISGRVYGGMTYDNQEVSGNTVIISGGTINNQIYGGYSAMGNATGNHLSILNGESKGNIYGGYSGSGNAVGNTVTISGGKMLGWAIIFGGNSNSGNAEDNTVTILGGYVPTIAGGDSQSGTVKGNNVIISGGEVNTAYGGSSGSGIVTGNTVTISGGKVHFVHGGDSSTGSTTKNTVIVTGGEVGVIYGGLSVKGQSTDNTVIVKGGLVDTIYGSYNYNHNATGNTVTISGSVQFNATGSLYGGYSNKFVDVFTNNTLNFSAHPVKVNEVANFQYYNFSLTPDLANTGNALINAQSIRLGDGSTPSTIKVIGIHSGNILNIGDQFILMQAGTMSGNGVGLTTTGVAQQGISLLYDVRTDVDINGKVVTATILGRNSNSNDGRSNAARVNPQLKALSEGYLAGSQLVMRGADLVADNTSSAINEQNNKNGWVPFVMMSGQHNRYNSGSHIKSDDFLLTGGLSYQQNNLTAGMLVEGGWGSYDSYNSFYNAADVKGDGNDRYYGLGLLGRYDFENHLYAEASLRFGRNHNKFDTQDIQNFATKEYASYNVTSDYISTHIGTGYVLNLSENNQLDLSSKYLWTQLDGKDINVAGDPIHFDRINSHRARIDAKLNHQYSKILTFNTGLGYEYEFDGKARATTYNIYGIDVPSIRGGTGIASVGANINPSFNPKLSLDIKANAYTGKREGVGANIRVNYAFN